MIHLITVAVLMVGLLAGCSSNSGDLVSDLGQPVEQMPCADPVAAFDEVPDDYGSVIDVAAFPVVDALRLGGADPESGRRFSKFGLFVRSGTTFQIHVAPDSSPNALVGWDNTGTTMPSESLLIDGCDGSCGQSAMSRCIPKSDKAWIVYPGEIWTSEPACVSLVVLSGDRSDTVTLPAGPSCN